MRKSRATPAHNHLALIDDVRRLAGRPHAIRECYRGVRAQASTTTLPASLASALRSRLRFGAVPAK